MTENLFNSLSAWLILNFSSLVIAKSGTFLALISEFQKAAISPG
jgi:hypothetical protein